MAHISVKAFGTSMIFRVPKDADMSELEFTGFKNRKQAQEQINEYLRARGYDPSRSHEW